ncbi:hypothetical protein [Nevskia ramosa]|uniref:hypothetical protein n=1 Tax=Nevskia ramosa TaxID=64002 RepID=UPI0003B4311E|nr:hypothetical protein [Nevskia ramosa]
MKPAAFPPDSLFFEVSAGNVDLHLKNLYEDEEFRREASAEESSVVQTEIGQEVGGRSRSKTSMPSSTPAATRSFNKTA